MSLVVDDHFLLEVLTDQHDDWVRAQMESAPNYTTSAWYYRLASAAHHGSGAGALSRRLAQVDPDRRGDTLDWLRHLPDWVGLIGPRLLVPVMASLDLRRRPNVLTAEALALALVTDATLVVATDGPLLRAGAAELGIGHELR